MSNPIRFCALEDTLDARDTRWNKPALSWFLQAGLPGVMLDAMREVMRLAFAQWALVARLSFTQADREDQADILQSTGPIDGPQGTLAWSELPPSMPCHQRYDTGERWSTDGTPGQAEIELLAVACHEIGHALGLQHDSQSGALMSPYYNASILKPTSRDIARIQALYGPPVATPTPPPTVPTPGQIVIRIDGAQRITVDGYKVTPL